MPETFQDLWEVIPMTSLTLANITFTVNDDLSLEIEIYNYRKSLTRKEKIKLTNYLRLGRIEKEDMDKGGDNDEKIHEEG